MDRIPDRSNQSPGVSQPVNDDKGKLGSKQVSRVDSETYLEKNSVHASGQPLNERQITSDTLQMMVVLGQQQQWDALTSAITDHGNNLDDLTSVMDTLRQHGIKLPEQIQNQAVSCFMELEAVNVADTLCKNLPTVGLHALGVLDHITSYHNDHDSPIGAIVRSKVDEFIKKYQLNDADQENLIQNMSAKIYSLISEKMKGLEELVIDDTTDAKIIEKIRHAQNERRILNSV